MNIKKPYTPITPTIDSPDPRMRRAIDGWLGLYEACYVIGNEMREGLVVAEDQAKYGTESSQPDPNDLVTALVKSAQALNEWNGFWVLGGGLAMNFHGQRRATEDVDFFIFADKEKLSHVIDLLSRRDVRPHAYENPSFMPPDALWWWMPFQYGLPKAAPVNVDLLVASHEFMAFAHATGIETQVQGTRIRVLGPEAFIILKLQAFRGKDQSDVEAILRSNSNIDRDLLQAWVAKFKLEARLAEIERVVRENPGRKG
jgi:predicted nucleotidyltransferase